MMTLPDVALLTAEDERRLSIEIEAGVLAEAALTGRLCWPHDATRAELAELARAGRAAEHTFWMANLRLITLVSARVGASSGVPEDDLFQDGWIGLADAVRRFDHRRGVRFATYALPWIRARIAEAVQRQHLVRVSRRRTSTRPPRAVPLDELQHSRAVIDDRAADFELVEGAVVDWDGVAGDLSDREWQVVLLRYGLDGGGPRTHDEVAGAVGCSHATARRLELRALATLRRALVRRGIESSLATGLAA